MTPDHAASQPLLADLDPVLRDRYLAGVCTPEDLRHIEAWISGDPARRATLAGLRRGLAAPIEYPAFASAPGLSGRIQAAIALTPCDSVRLDQAPYMRAVFAKKSISRIPARDPGGWGKQTLQRYGVFSAAVAGLLVFLVHERPTPRQASTADRVYSTTIGQRATITLTDGSRVMLAPQTHFRVPVAFGTADRTVRLVGEAYFEIAPATGVPFVVEAGNVVTQVLGTAFDVKHYANEHATRIVVDRGKVQSKGLAGDTAITLTAGMIGVVTDSTATIGRSDNIETYTSWMKGQLDFQDVPIVDALATMERWYGVRFRLADSSLITTKVSGSFAFKRTSAALSALQSVLGVRMTFERAGDTTVVTLFPRMMRTAPTPTRLHVPQSFNSQMEIGR